MAPSDSEQEKRQGQEPPALLPLRVIDNGELRRHSSASSLWLSIHGLVYDVTPWLPLHPGGDLPLLSLAGRDATDPFLASSSPSPSPSSSSPPSPSSSSSPAPDNGDPDLQHMPLFAVSSRLFSSIHSFFYQRTLQFHPLAKFLLSYQHITFYPVMGFARINLFAQSIILLLTNNNIPHRRIEILGVLFFWLWYPLLVSCLPNWPDRIAFVVASFNVTGIQHVQFCLNHFSSQVYLGPPAGMLSVLTDF
ncbi:Delta(8)-fatty-acid desaturase [Rhynchospora pubera]|uniref:Delta(8)-fatty-acid desaturase n=1 Tax=Rhynchospora pubera TaxID=906938 RepID=A0AAV8CMH5_9POAL|nr:Delta(8)-fatty-acid desaturase [Rhynchospora pubera]